MAFFDIQQSLMQARWAQAEPCADTVERLVRAHSLPEVVARLLCARGIGEAQVEAFLRPRLGRDFPDPLAMAGMADAAEAIAQAIMAGRTIGIFGDFDVDGATSTAILCRFLRHCGIDAPVHIPDRAKEGYGPNLPALLGLQARDAGLVILVDCGITGFEPIAAARAAGLDLIVLDHHQAEGQLPLANHVVNPNRRDDVSGFGMLAACGVVFLTCVAVNTVLRREAWYARSGRAEPPLKDLLDLVALGTVCDVVPLTGPNRLFVRAGLERMAGTDNPGLAALAQVSSVNGAPTPYTCGFVFGPRINAGSRVHQADLGARLLCTDDAAEARELAFILNDCNDKRKLMQAEMTSHAERLVEDGALHGHPAIVVDHDAWHPGLSGLVAGRLREKYDRPAIVIALAPGESGMEGKGSGRSVPGVNLGAVFIDARNEGHLLKGGGHAMAAGFTVAAEKLADFRTFLLAHVSAQLAGRPAMTETMIDAAITVRGLTPAFVKTICEQVGPFGPGNPEPLFALTDVRLHQVDRVGEDHVRCLVSDWEGGPRLKAIAFRSAGTPLGQALLKNIGQPFHLLCHVKIDRWNGDERVELLIQDAALAMAGSKEHMSLRA